MIVATVGQYDSQAMGVESMPQRGPRGPKPPTQESPSDDQSDEMPDRAAQVALGKNIKRLREEAGLTQEQLAKAADLSRADVNRIENFNAKSTLATVGKLARYFGVSIPSLLE